MPWPTEELRRRFTHPCNEEVLCYLEAASPSAHSDLGILLIEAIRPLPGAGFFGPNLTACSYVLAHTDHRIVFALAIGMTNLALRLPNAHPATQPLPDIAPGWHGFNPFDARLSQAQSRGRVEELIGLAFDWAQRS